MTRSLEEKRGLSAPDARVLGDIQRVGWHVTGVFAQRDATGPEWAFSIGLFHSFQHPEVVVFGLPFQRCMDIVSLIGQEVQTGKRYEPGAEYTDILQGRTVVSFERLIVSTVQTMSATPCGFTKTSRSH